MRFLALFLIGCFFLSAIISLQACGVKPGSLAMPDNAAENEYPRRYPTEVKVP